MGGIGEICLPDLPRSRSPSRKIFIKQSEIMKQLGNKAPHKIWQKLQMTTTDLQRLHVLELPENVMKQVCLLCLK